MHVETLFEHTLIAGKDGFTKSLTETRPPAQTLLSVERIVSVINVLVEESSVGRICDDSESITTRLIWQIERDSVSSSLRR